MREADLPTSQEGRGNGERPKSRGVRRYYLVCVGAIAYDGQHSGVDLAREGLSGQPLLALSELRWEVVERGMRLVVEAIIEPAPQVGADGVEARLVRGGVSVVARLASAW